MGWGIIENLKWLTGHQYIWLWKTERVFRHSIINESINWVQIQQKSTEYSGSGVINKQRTELVWFLRNDEEQCDESE